MRSVRFLLIGVVAFAGSAVGGEEPQRAGESWWSLQPLRRPEMPRVGHAGWVRNPIDAFVLAELEKRGLEPAEEAEKLALLRRVFFDLIGLPPGPEEIEAFARDTSPDAYEKVVDRLLASPHHGERWGRHWLDVVRFGESQGFERDKLRPNAWPYRDYVIGSLNKDKPYTDFIKEQLAGDVLEPATPEGIAATGFLVAGPWDEVGHNQQGAVMRQRVREEELEDMVSVIGQTFLGLTVNCARCHDHKIDPIPQRDYYRLKAAIEGARPGDRSVLTPALVRKRAARLDQLQKEIATLEQEAARITQAARLRLRPTQQKPAVTGLPEPMARWTFEEDASDSVGGLHGKLQGGARIADGRLRLDGKKAHVGTATLGRPLREKTLEAWVLLRNRTQRGGGVVSVQTRGGKVFDAIVFGERQTGKWIAGSSFFHRTRDLEAAAENSEPGQLIHVAIVYRSDNQIGVYRNGRPYGQAYVPPGAQGKLQTYEANDGQVLFGLRHTGAGNGFLSGEIEEARLYDRALTAEEVAASADAGVERIPLEDVLRALTPEERRKREEVLARAASARARVDVLPKPQQVYAVLSKQPAKTHVLNRGDVLKPLEEVSAGGLSALKTPSPEWGLPADAAEGLRRQKLAEWIASEENPLTARVIVNRLWHYHFGAGIVATPNDLGFNGSRPTHPALLDWLASDLMAHGWSLKHLHRLIVTSSTYRQGGRFDARAAKVDADNRWLWRFAPRRLEGEAVRDAMLVISGDLNPTVGGPSFQPFTVRVFNSTFYDLTDPIGPEFDRRTIYRMNVGSARSPFLDAFDCPEPSVKAPARNVTTTPLQALALMNSSFVLRQARHFAARVQASAHNDIEQVEYAYQIAFGRKASEEESVRATRLVRKHGLESLCWVLLNGSELLYLR